MADIYPFQGIYFDKSRVDIDRVIAPPYDVLSVAEQDALYERDPHNIVRIILNRASDSDGPSANRYLRAAGFLNDWLATGALARDNSPAYYEYIQRFAHPIDPTRSMERRTLLVALKLAPYAEGVVLPHEETHPKAKADRLELMRATHANPEPIYALYEDPEQVVSRALDVSRGGGEPLLHARVQAGTGEREEEHVLYRHGGSALIEALDGFMRPRRIWIADGHHRYETALNYRHERRDAEGNPEGLQGYDTLLVGLSAFEDPGLVVLPTHRLVRNVPAQRIEALLPQLQRYFQIRSLTVEAAKEWIRTETPGEKRFVLVHPKGAYALVLRDLGIAEAGAAEGHCDAWKRLDVSILQSLVLDRTLGISWRDLAHTPDVAYTRDVEEAVAKVASGEFQVACLLQNPTVTEVRDVASAGDKMPQKSTFFYPKLWSGLMLRRLD